MFNIHTQILSGGVKLYRWQLRGKELQCAGGVGFQCGWDCACGCSKSLAWAEAGNLGHQCEQTRAHTNSLLIICFLSFTLLHSLPLSTQTLDAL